MSVFACGTQIQGFRRVLPGKACGQRSFHTSFSSRYFAGRVQYSTNGASTLQIQRDLLVCGDISSNPGPAKGKDKPKFPCGECSKPVRKNQDAILCSSCDTWSHAKCLELTVTGFKYYLQHPDLEWTCAFCSLPKLSDSFFDETGSFTLNESNCETRSAKSNRSIPTKS